MTASSPFPLPLFAVGASLFAGCSGGSGPNPPPLPTPDPVNEGSFSVEAFAYQDPQPAEYQPLSGEITTIVELAELAVLDPSGQVGSHILDPNDPDPAGLPTITGIVDIEPIDFAVGQIDADREEELLAITVTGDVMLLESNGSWSPLPLPVGNEIIATGDVDGDGLDEIVLLDGCLTDEVLISVYDDAEHVHAPLHSSSWNPGWLTNTIDARLADLDDDGRDEISVLAYVHKYTASHWVYLNVLDDHQNQYQGLGMLDLSMFADSHPRWPGTLGIPISGAWPLAPLETGSFSGLGISPRIIVGDFDPSHAGQEVCVASIRHWLYSTIYVGGTDLSGYSLRYNVCALDQGMLQDRGREIVLLGVSDPSARDAQVTSLDVAMVAADLDGSGSDELVFVHRYPTTERGISTATVPRFQHSPLAAYVISVDGTEDRWSSPEWNLALPGSACPLDTSVSSLFPSVPVPASTEVRLAAGDWDADGREELYVSTGFDGNSSISRVHAIRDQGKWHLEAGPPETLAFSSSPIVTGGDFDGDNLVVRYTGNKELALGEPLPIVLVAAPPTKSGISQCYDDSCTSYGTEQGFSQSYGVAAGITASVSAGMNAADPFGIASASVMVTLGKEFEKTNTTTTFETHTQTFTNSCEEDGIIFQGTLYNCYEYEVIFGKPSLIGEHIRLNIPVDARVFKWTLGFYNDTIDPEYRIDPSILGHSIGDPESYMRKQQALDLASTYVGWAAGQEVAVGQGQGSNAVGISLVEEQATETTRSWSVSLDCEYSLFGAAWGHSIGVTGSDIYTIGLTEGTHYEGVVGDISDPAEYGEWSYSFGLLAYNRGVLSDANNEPIGLEEGHLPFQVLTYWTTPTGTGY